MLRVLLLVLTIVLLLMAAPVAAIPICPTATMADYLALGSTGVAPVSWTVHGFRTTRQLGVVFHS
jgi:hypothetical protein